MATSPRARSGTLNRNSIIVYEDDTRDEDDGLGKSVFDVSFHEDGKRDSTGESGLGSPCQLAKDDFSTQKCSEHMEDEPVGSVGYGAALGRDFSNHTAIHLVHGERHMSDPFVDDGIEERGLEDVYEERSDEDEELEQDLDDYGLEDDDDDDDDDDAHSGHFDAPDSCDTSFQQDSRKVSEYSALPDDMNASLPPAPTPPVWKEHSSYRTSTPAHTSPLRNGSRLLSSPQTTGGRHFSPVSTSHVKDGRFVSSPLARRHDHSSPFRNPSSVQEIQMSCPSPPPGLNHTPRSARQRRLDLETSGESRKGTPSRNPGVQSSRVPSNIGSPMTPSRQSHQNPQKEYPLVLLHCSFSAPPLPYSPAVVRAVLPDSIQESLMLLREKLGPTVLDRGILIPHPRDDYELLEERVLESLELKTPRVGKCGHFIGTESRKTSAATDARQEEETFEAKTIENLTVEPKCTTCGKHVADSHRGCEGDNRKRWDISVYASNGLMRAGAWATAWREMEKVDIEINVWLPEDMRLSLEREAQLELEREGEDIYYDDAAPNDPDVYAPYGEDTFRSASERAPRSTYEKAESSPASRAACSRPAPSKSRSPKQKANEREALFTLLMRYFKRNLLQRPNVLLHVLIVALALTIFAQWHAKPLVHDIKDFEASDIDAEIPASPPFHIVDPDSGAQMISTLATTPQRQLPVTKTITEQIDAQIPACTFAVEQASDMGMTALPSSLAKSVLNAVQTEATRQATKPAETDVPTIEHKLGQSEGFERMEEGVPA